MYPIRNDSTGWLVQLTTQKMLIQDALDWFQNLELVFEKIWQMYPS